MATIQIKIDDDTKLAAESLFKNYGLDTETALKMFLSTAIKEKGIPFLLKSFNHVENEEQEAIRQKRLAAKGSLKGSVWMADDFDEPLEDMKEYME